MKPAGSSRSQGGFLERFRGRQREFSRQGREWLRRYPRVQRLLEATGCLKGGAEAMARGVAVGLFIGLTPTVGFQTPLMILGCLLTRGNFLTAFMVSWVSNPFTMGPLYWGFHAVGQGMFGILPLQPGEASAWVLRGPGDEMLFTVVGSLLVALPAALIGYLVSHRLSVVLAARRRRRGVAG